MNREDEAVMKEDHFYCFLQGSTIFLREVRLSDVNDNYYCWMNDPEVNDYLETRFFPQSMGKIQEYVEMTNAKSDQVFLAVCLNQDGRHIGNIKLGPINWIHRFAEISLIIGDKEQWGKGHATEAIKLVADYAFQVLDLHKITAGSYSTHAGSVRAFVKAGFEIEGTGKKQYFCKGEYVDIIRLGKIRD